MQNSELAAFMARHLADIDYSLRELRQAYLLSGVADPRVDRDMERAGEAIADARARTLTDRTGT